MTNHHGRPDDPQCATRRTGEPLLDKKYHFPTVLEKRNRCDRWRRCNTPICKTCQTRKAQRHQRKIERILKNTHSLAAELEAPNPLHRVVLTVHRQPGLLKPRLDHLWDAFTTLKRSPWFSQHVYG